MSKQLLTETKAKLLSFRLVSPWRRFKSRSAAVCSTSLFWGERYKKNVFNCTSFRREHHAAGFPKVCKCSCTFSSVERSVNDASQNSELTHCKNKKYIVEKSGIKSDTIEECHNSKRLDKREQCRKSKRLDNRQEYSILNRGNSDFETQGLGRPNLSDVLSSNFRIRLYRELNVVQSRLKKSKAPGYISGVRKYAREVPCSMPIATGMEQRFDHDEGSMNRKWVEHNTFQTAERLDIEDIFVLDI